MRDHFGVHEGSTDDAAARRTHRRAIRRKRQRALRLAEIAASPDVKVVREFTPEHLRLEIGGVLFDYWPTSGRWRESKNHDGPTGLGGVAKMRAHARAKVTS